MKISTMIYIHQLLVEKEQAAFENKQKINKLRESSIEIDDDHRSICEAAEEAYLEWKKAADAKNDFESEDW